MRDTASDVFVLACRKCRATITAPAAICGACGPSYRYVAGCPSDGTTWLACGGCHAGTVAGPAPERCSDCGVADLGWRSMDGSGWWDSRAAADVPAVWVTGWFDSGYVGTQQVHSTSQPLGARSYRFEFAQPRLSDLQTVLQPPIPVANDGAEPLCWQQFPGMVRVRHRASATAPETEYDVALYDFRLHDWSHASRDEVVDGVPQLFGRIWGTAYARLTPPQARPLPVHAQADTTPLSVPGILAPAAGGPVALPTDQPYHEAPSGTASAATLPGVVFPAAPSRPLSGDTAPTVPSA
ncbi:hypothetical protein E4K72_00475, partial [Oxalobacteraceae bacterium OM1]